MLLWKSLAQIKTIPGTSRREESKEKKQWNFTSTCAQGHCSCQLNCASVIHQCTKETQITA